MNYRLIYLFLLLAIPIKSFSQDVWTLERCIDYAIENNLSIKRQDLSSQISRKDYYQSMYDLLPGIGIGVEHQLSSGRSLNLEKYEWENAKIQQGSAGVRGEITILSGLTNYNNIQLNKFLYLSNKEDLEALKNNMTLTLAAYYLDVLFSEELLEVAKSRYEVTLLEVEKNNKLVEVGNAARSELFEIQAQAANDKLQVTMAENTLNMAILDLTQLLDLDSIGGFTVYRPDNLSVEDLIINQSMPDIYSTAVENMPQIKSAEYKVEAQKKMVAINVGRVFPEFYLTGLYYSRYLNGAVNPLDPDLSYTLGNQLKDNRYAQLTIGMSIPLFSKGQNITRISKSKLVLNDYQLALEQQKQVLYKSIQQYYADAMGAMEKYISAGEAVKSNEEAFKYTQQKFQVGLVNSVDFNVALNNLTKARSDYAQAKYEYIFKVKILDFYRGKPIRL